MASPPPVEQTVHEIVRLCHAGLDGPSLRQEVLSRLRRAIGIDAVFWATADPATVLFTGATREELAEDSTALFLKNEFLQDDVNKFATLARSRDPVNSLYAATAGEYARSPRFRDILAPMGFGDELRAALTVDGACSGHALPPSRAVRARFRADGDRLAAPGAAASCRGAAHCPSAGRARYSSGRPESRPRSAVRRPGPDCCHAGGGAMAGGAR